MINFLAKLANEWMNELHRKKVAQFAETFSIQNSLSTVKWVAFVHILFCSQSRHPIRIGGIAIAIANLYHSHHVSLSRSFTFSLFICATQITAHNRNECYNFKHEIKAIRASIILHGTSNMCRMHDFCCFCHCFSPFAVSIHSIILLILRIGYHLPSALSVNLHRTCRKGIIFY